MRRPLSRKCPPFIWFSFLPQRMPLKEEKTEFWRGKNKIPTQPAVFLDPSHVGRVTGITADLWHTVEKSEYNGLESLLSSPSWWLTVTQGKSYRIGLKRWGQTPKLSIHNVLDCSCLNSANTDLEVKDFFKTINNNFLSYKHSPH